MPDASPPFRWDLITPDRLGSLLDGPESQDLWFLAELIACAGKVLARSGDGDLHFVGRSLDSMYDLLGGALGDTDWRRRLHRLPFSFARPAVQVGSGKWRARPLSDAEVAQARRLLSGAGLDPCALARLDRPATFVDVVAEGSTFTTLFRLLSDWIDETTEPWNAIRLKIRFVGVTTRRHTSPNTYRWQQHEEWTRRLPARSVVNVSLDPYVWSYFGNTQVKLTRSYRPERWLAEVDGPRRDERTRQALAEAVALVRHGRTRQTRRALARAISGEPAMAEPWLRSLALTLR